MKPCISEATTMSCNFADDVAAYADAGCGAMEVWLTKLETHLESHSVTAVRQLLAERNMSLAAAAYQGGLLLSQGEQRKAHFDHFRQRLDICQQFSIATLIVIADFAGDMEATDFERAVVSLKQASQWAAGFGVRLALEFRGHSPFCASLDTALGLLAQCDEPNLGVNFDFFHYYTGPSKFEDIELLTAETLAHVQICDVSGVPRELAADSDRILPGDGDFRIAAILERFREIGYDGYVSLELLNPTLWQANARQVAEIGFTALRRALGLSQT